MKRLAFLIITSTPSVKKENLAQILHHSFLAKSTYFHHILYITLNLLIKPQILGSSSYVNNVNIL